MKISMDKQKSISVIMQENAVLREEVQVARKASDITAQLVVEQFMKIEGMLRRLEESQTRYRDLYQQSRQREQLYESLLNSTPDAVVICDLKCHIIYVNPAFTRLFGFTREEALDRDAHSFIPAREIKKFNAVVEQVFTGQPVSRLETKHISKSGKPLDISLSASSYVNHLEKPAGVMMILRDNTERKRAERLLQRERETFFTMLQSAPYGVGMLDKDENVIYLNPEFTRIIGYRLEEIPTLTAWMEKAYPSVEQRRWVIGNWSKKSISQKREKIFQVTCKDGESKEIEFRRTVLEDGRIIVMLSDVTERQRTEEQIRLAKEQWEKTFDSIDDAITIQDLNMCVLRVNRAAARLLGLEPKDLIGRHCFEIFDDRSEPCPDCPQKLTMEDLTHHSRQIEHAKLGKSFFVAASPIFNEKGELSGIVHSAKDITEKLKTEEELTKAQKLESVGILAGGIAHDFNNILTTILGNVTLAKMYPGVSGKAAERLEEAEKACFRAKDLTQQLLTFSRGGAPIKKATSVTELVKESVSFSLMGSNVRCKYEIAKDLWPVEIDEGQMSQVINNLIINACQAMPQGGEIKIRLENVECSTLADNCRDDRYVRISISDRGVGIPKENLSKIFDPYFTTKTTGSGLGLSMAYSIIKRHDGQMRVESKLGESTTFYIDIPATSTQPVKSTVLSESPVSDSGKGRILVMDDEKQIRNLVGQMLSFLGYEVGLALDGNEAIEMYEEAQRGGHPFDAVIMDLTVPGGLGGKEALEKLRRRYPDIKAVVSSGYNTDPIMSDFREHGFSGVIAKPYRLKDLSETLRDILSR